MAYGGIRLVSPLESTRIDIDLPVIPVHWFRAAVRRPTGEEVVASQTARGAVAGPEVGENGID